MADWLRTVSNTNGKYCVDMMIDETWQRVSSWYDSIEEAELVVTGYINAKSMFELEEEENSFQDGATKTEEDVYPYDPV